MEVGTLRTVVHSPRFIGGTPFFQRLHFFQPETHQKVAWSLSPGGPVGSRCVVGRPLPVGERSVAGRCLSANARWLAAAGRPTLGGRPLTRGVCGRWWAATGRSPRHGGGIARESCHCGYGKQALCGSPTTMSWWAHSLGSRNAGHCTVYTALMRLPDGSPPREAFLQE